VAGENARKRWSTGWLSVEPSSNRHLVGAEFSYPERRPPMAKSTQTVSHTQERPKVAEAEGKGPVFTCRHRALKAAVWKNETANGVMFNTTVTRSYKDGEEWKESGSFGWDDLLIIAELLRTCYGFIAREMRKDSKET
jgi:hypothetical protein